MVNWRRSMVLVVLSALVALGLGVFYSAAAGGVRPASSGSGRRRQVAPPIVGLTRAYGVVLPGCGTCDPTRKPGFSPLRRGVNVALTPSQPHAPGTWCFALKGGLNENSVAVVVSAANTGGPYIKHFAAEQAEWIMGAPNCGPGGDHIEIRTSGEEIEHGMPVFVPSDEIAFSFVVEAG